MTGVKCACSACSAWRASLQQLIGLVSDVIPAAGIPDQPGVSARKRAYAEYVRQARQKRVA
jgi:hypothetical protein